MGSSRKSSSPKRNEEREEREESTSTPPNNVTALVRPQPEIAELPDEADRRKRMFDGLVELERTFRCARGDVSALVSSHAIAFSPEEWGRARVVIQKAHEFSEELSRFRDAVAGTPED